MILDDLELTRCVQCGKLFQKEPGKTLCLECAPLTERPSEILQETPRKTPPEPPKELDSEERELIQNLSSSTGLPSKVIEESIRALTESENARAEEAACVRCKKRPPLEEGDLCVYCRLDLYRRLGNAAQDLFDQMEMLEPGETGPSSVISSYENKRRRTAASRINPTGAQWLKRYTG